MVYEDESSNKYSSLLYISSSDDGMQYQVDDQDYMGVEPTLLVPCEHHGLAAERCVAFEGFDTGRRFLVCANKEADNCGFVRWVDPEWPPTQHNALWKLWEMYPANRSGRRKDNHENSLTIHHFTEEKNKLEGNYDKLVEDVHELFGAQEDRMMDFIYLNAKMKGAEVTKSVVSDMNNLKLNHLKEKEQLSEASRNLQLQVDELNKSVEKLTQENSKLKLHMGDLKKGHEKLARGRAELKLHIADLLRSDEKNRQKLKGI
nr:uncharacterized protein LOC109776099 [Aegilops tauschii subsp. strangulata]